MTISKQFFPRLATTATTLQQQTTRKRTRLQGMSSGRRSVEQQRRRSAAVVVFGLFFVLASPVRLVWGFNWKLQQGRILRNRKISFSTPQSFLKLSTTEGNRHVVASKRRLADTEEHEIPSSSSRSRRQALQTVFKLFSLTAFSTISAPGIAMGEEEETTTPPSSSTTIASPQQQQQLPPQRFIRQSNKFVGYEFQPPPNFEAGNKPLKTHLDEVNFQSTKSSGYQFGITIDPVRIQSLAQFGTPEEVAAKVVLAELNRDGVFDVTLMQDPMAVGTKEKTDTFYYQLNYLSAGKRGKKRFIAKFFIHEQKLYALTAQCKEEDYADKEKEILEAVDSFRILQ